MEMTKMAARLLFAMAAVAPTGCNSSRSRSQRHRSCSRVGAGNERSRYQVHCGVHDDEKSE